MLIDVYHLKPVLTQICLNLNVTLRTYAILQMHFLYLLPYHTAWSFGLLWATTANVRYVEHDIGMRNMTWATGLSHLLTGDGDYETGGVIFFMLKTRHEQSVPHDRVANLHM